MTVQNGIANNSFVEHKGTNGKAKSSSKDIGAHSLLAPSYVPKEWRQIFLVPGMSAWPTQPMLSNWTGVQQLYRSSVQEPPQCLCPNDEKTTSETEDGTTRTKHPIGEDYPWDNLPGMIWNPQYALSPAAARRKDPAFRVEIPDMDKNVHSLQDYVSAFCTLLSEEYEENLMLYERYTQFNVTVKVRKDRNTNKAQTSSGGDSPMPPSLSRAVLEIPGIYDARPPLQSGDRVLLRPMTPVGLPPGQEPIEIQATVVSTIRAANDKQKDRVVITWVWDFQDRILYGKRFAVRFLPTPTSFDRCLAALKWLKTSLHPTTSKELLFPSKHPKVDMGSSARAILDNKSKDPQLQPLDKQQYQFVQMAITRSADPSLDQIRPPMILTGPAGTGKTKTLLTALLKTLSLDVTSARYPKRMLVCTPSHTACDVLTRRLGKHLERERIFRLYDSTRPVEMVPVEMLGYTRQGSMGEFILPSATEFEMFQVVVCTCSDAQLLFLSGMTNASMRNRRKCLQTYTEKSLASSGLVLKGSIEGANTPIFTHLFVDEAAQASEPETLIPLSVVMDDEPGIPKVEIVLSGDPRQLNPDIYSRFAGPSLRKSFLERLLRLPDFGGRDHLMGPPTKDTWKTLDELIEYSFQGDDDSGKADQYLSVFLTTSYRGHPSFLHIPSKLFYLDKLKSVHPDDMEDAQWCMALRKIESLSNLAYPCEEKKYSWPIHFVGVVGQDVSLAVESFWGSNSWCNHAEAETVVDIVVTLCQDGASTKAIGVMAAFRAQVLYIRRLLRSKNLDSVNVGMVEDYQAVERQVIVLSLTRSNESFVVSDVNRNSGLFHQPKRVNVALTRAEDLLIVVGNPDIMNKDPHWSTWLSYCKKHGFWYGKPVAASS